MTDVAVIILAGASILNSVGIAMLATRLYRLERRVTQQKFTVDINRAGSGFVTIHQVK